MVRGTREWAPRHAVIDYFSLALAHMLILIALWRLSGDDALDDDPAFPKKRGGVGSELGRTPPQERRRDA